MGNSDEWLSNNHWYPIMPEPVMVVAVVARAAPAPAIASDRTETRYGISYKSITADITAAFIDTYTRGLHPVFKSSNDEAMRHGKSVDTYPTPSIVTGRTYSHVVHMY